MSMNPTGGPSQPPIDPSKSVPAQQGNGATDKGRLSDKEVLNIFQDFGAAFKPTAETQERLASGGSQVSSLIGKAINFIKEKLGTTKKADEVATQRLEDLLEPDVFEKVRDQPLPKPPSFKDSKAYKAEGYRGDNIKPLPATPSKVLKRPVPATTKDILSRMNEVLSGNNNFSTQEKRALVLEAKLHLAENKPQLGSEGEFLDRRTILEEEENNQTLLCYSLEVLTTDDDRLQVSDEEVETLAKMPKEGVAHEVDTSPDSKVKTKRKRSFSVSDATSRLTTFNKKLKTEESRPKSEDSPSRPATPLSDASALSRPASEPIKKVSKLEKQELNRLKGPYRKAVYDLEQQKEYLKDAKGWEVDALERGIVKLENEIEAFEATTGLSPEQVTKS